MRRFVLIERSASAPDSWQPLAASHGSFYHDPRWVNALAASFGFRTLCLTATDAGAVRGMLALAEVPGLLGGRRLVSYPFSFAAGPCALAAEVAMQLVEEARTLAAARGIRRLEIKVTPGALPVAVPGFERVSKYAAYVVDTGASEDELMARLSTSTRRGIRQAEKAGVTIVTGTDEASWLAMSRLQDLTARGHGIPAPPRDFFAETCRALQAAGLADLLLARDPAGRAVAGMVIYRGTREWIYAFGASDPNGIALRPTHLMMWHAVRAAREAGVSLNLGRAAPEQEGLVEFKRRWGGVAVPLAYDYWPAAGGVHLANRSGGWQAAAKAVWSRLPLPVTRLAAPMYRYLG